MNKRIFHKMLITILMTIGFSVLIRTTSNAASLSISTSKSSVSPGESFSITVSVSGGAGYVDLSASNANLSSTRLDLMLKSSATVTCTAGTSGTISISASGTIADYTTENDESKSASTSVLIVQQSNGNNNGSSSGGSTGNTGSSSSASSSNANLSDLGIRPNDFKGFKPGTTTYNATVPNDVTSVEVYAKVQAQGAKYSVSGSKNLQVGTNPIRVTVTAPDGKTQKTYTIYVARQSAGNEEVTPNVIEPNSANDTNNENQEPEENTEEKEPLGLISIAIDDSYDIYLEPEFKSDIYEYTINLNEDLKEIPLNAIANRENAKIEIIGNEDLQDGENIITIRITDEETEETAEYKITVRKGMLQQEKAENKETKNSEETKWLIIAVATGAVALVIIVVVSYILVKRRKKFEREFGVEYEEEYDEDEKLEENSRENEDYDNRDENGKEEQKDRQNDVYIQNYDVEQIKVKKRGKGKHF